MKIWIVSGDCRGRACFEAEDNTFDSHDLYNFQDKECVNDWRELKITFTCGKKRKDILPMKNVTSFTSYSFLFVCDEFAKQKLSEKYDCIQFLRVMPIEKEIRENSNYYLPNVLTTVKVLDETKSKFKYLSGKYITGVEKYYFLDSVKEYPVFYLNTDIKNRAFLDIYAIDEFKDYVESCGITGFRFKEVFDFDDPDKKYPLM